MVDDWFTCRNPPKYRLSSVAPNAQSVTDGVELGVYRILILRKTAASSPVCSCATNVRPHHPFPLVRSMGAGRCKSATLRHHVGLNAGLSPPDRDHMKLSQGMNPRLLRQLKLNECCLLISC